MNHVGDLSLFIATVAHLINPFRTDQPQFGMLALKASFRGDKYASEILKRLPQKAEPIRMARIFDQMARLGSVHNAELALSMS